ncbi:MAG: hypothetical protein ACOZCL_06350 [Bacillota bacterium]
MVTEKDWINSSNNNIEEVFCMPWPTHKVTAGGYVLNIQGFE